MRRMPVPPSLVAGIILTSIFAVAALVSFVWTPHAVDSLNITARLQTPGPEHLLGTDHFGRDMLSMLMVGARTSIAVAIVAVGIGMALGVPLGLLAAATRGGWLDDLVMRGNDLVFAFPSLVIAILITAVFGPSAFNAILAIGIFNTPVFARVTRGSALAVWTQDFILAAREHARHMHDHPAAIKHLAMPFFEAFDAGGADREFFKMQGHGSDQKQCGKAKK